MKINKKYILSILFLFSTANTLPIRIDQLSEKYIVIGSIGLVCIFITYCQRKHIIKAVTRFIDKKLCQKIFGKNYFDTIDIDLYRYPYNLDTENIHKTEWYIQKYGSIIRILLKLLLFFEHTSTQHSHADYIHTVYKSGKYTQAKSIVKFLLDCGIDPRFLRVDDKYLLTQLCHSNDPDSMELMEDLLIKHKIHPNHRNRQFGNHIGGGDYYYRPSIEGASDPLCVASYRNNTRAVQLLISCGTDTHPFLDCDPEGNPAVSHAIKHNNKEMFKGLFAYTVHRQINLGIKIFSLKKISEYLENKDIEKHILTYLVRISLPFGNQSLTADSIIDSCFQCDEKIWLPHLKIVSSAGDTRPPRKAKDFYSDKKPGINYDTWQANLKKQVIEFLPHLQITY